MEGIVSRRPRREGVLRRRLMGTFLLLALVPLFGSNSVGYLRSQVIVERLVTRYLVGMAALQAAHVEGKVEQRLLYLSAIGSGNRFLQAAADRFNAGRGSGMSEEADSEAVRTYLTRKLEESGRFGALALFSVRGDLIASTRGDRAVTSWTPREAAEAVLVHSDAGDTPPSLRLTIPVTDQPGAAEAYLVATIPLDQGGEFLEIPRHVAGTIESFILDGAGRPIFVSHPHGHMRYDQPLGSPLVSHPPGTHARYEDREGVEVIGASALLSSYGWLFVAEAPVADALGELGILRDLSLMLGALFAGLVLAAGWLLSGGIVAPVRRLVSATRALGSGDLDARVPQPGSDEIGELSEAFNEMAEDLKASQERIESLHRSEIERAQQLATVGELASGVAHEIKNPVVGISNGLDLVLRRVEDPALAPITDEMKRQLQRIEGAVSDLLAFARPTPPKLAPTDLNQVVARAVSLVGPAAGKRGVELLPELADVPPTTADAELLQQALVNLLMNAVQVSPVGSFVRIRTDASTDSVSVTVVDEGPGLSPEDVEQSFKPFHTTRHSGTGLGLPITRGIVEQHGGNVEVVSEPGSGSSFIIRLPIRRADASEAR